MTWSLNDVRIASNGRRMLSSSGLRFSEVKESDAGRYTVTVKNSAGSSDLSFNLLVLVMGENQAFRIQFLDFKKMNFTIIR